MKNNISIIFFYSLLLNLSFYFPAIANDQFEFDITNIEIKDNGNKIYGYNRGIVNTDSQIKFEADEFYFNKSTNILTAYGNIIAEDLTDNSKIYTDKITYSKNDEKIFTEGNSRAIKDDITIDANYFQFNRKSNILIAEEKVKINDLTDNSKIYTDKITYSKNDEKIFTEGNSRAIKDDITIDANYFQFNRKSNILIAEEKVKIIDKKTQNNLFTNKATYKKNIEEIFTTGETKSLIKKKFEFFSSDTKYNRNNSTISSSKKSYLTDNNSKLYKFDKFKFFINDELLKAKNIEIISENFLQNGFSDYAHFSSGFFNIGNSEFIAKNSKFYLKKDTFGNIENQPRLYGSSSTNTEDFLKINKGVFTSCNKNMECPAWAIEANKITHDKKKRQIIYDDAILKIYNMPVMYMPKFFHPDPTVRRQSGFLQPQLNGSEILTSSIYIPYFHVISDNKDATLQTTLFEDKKILLQNEYREKNKDSDLIADFGYVSKYKSKNSQSHNSIFHIFLDFEKDLDLDQYTSSSIKINLEKISNDTYLKVFENNLTNTKILPDSKNKLNSKVSIVLDNEKYQFSGGFEFFEDLKGVSKNDKYEYNFPYYDVTRNPILFKNTLFNFNSSGYNQLSDTNKLTSKITNNFNINSIDIISSMGFQNNFNLYFKNTNFLGKKNPSHKNSPTSKLKSIFEANTSFPLTKINLDSIDYLIPKISIRINPSNMKDKSTENRNIDVSNIFNVDRMSLGDEFETGKSLTLGLDYKKEQLSDINKYFSFKLGTVLRDKEQNFIPNSSTLNKKTSNLFGSIENNFNDFFNVNYQFSLDNDYNSFEYNSLTTKFNFGALNTNFIFTEENGERGDTNVLENKTVINFNENHLLTFNTRRNRKIALTEYYDLVYSYKNDCLQAGLKYKKSYYEDRDLKPNEDLLLTLTISPITNYEQKIDNNLYRN